MAMIPLDRVSTGTRMDLLQSAMRKVQEEIARREREISTGVRVERPSDDPLAAVRILGYQAGAERADQYLKNITLASGELGAVDGALGTLGGIADRAREILLGQISDTATEQTRRNASIDVAGLLESAVAAANARFGTRFIFGGADGLRSPVEISGEYVSWNPAAALEPEIHIGRGEAIVRGASGTGALGALTAAVEGGIDLDPRLTRETRLEDANGGFGIRTGKIRIDDGLGRSETVDVTGAETIGEVLDRIAATGIASAEVSASGGGIAITAAAGDLTVAEVDGGWTARDLGIGVSGAGPSFEGSDLDPLLRLTTPLADLLGGAGLDPAGFTVRNGGSSASISLDGLETVEDLLNAVSGSGARVEAVIDEGRREIVIRSNVSGAPLSIEEGAGSTGAQLGLVKDLSEVALDRLNGGLGVSEGSGDDFRITDGAGATFAVDISGARTVGDVIARIDGAAGNPGTVTASFIAGEDRIRIDDDSGGAGVLRIESLGGVFAAENLGIAGRASAPGEPIAGSDLRVSGVQGDSIFTALIPLRDALASNDQGAMALAGRKLEAASARLLDARAEVGARIQRVETTRSRLGDQKVELRRLYEEDRGADLAEAVTEFQRQQIILQATYSVTGQVLSLSLLDFLR